VRVFLAEKGVSVPIVPVDMGAMEHRSAAITALNPFQRLPILELDDGTVLTESIAICRYFEELHPEPSLFGRATMERVLIEMWQRRIELNLLASVAAAFRHTHPAMKDWEVPQIPEWGEVNRPKALSVLEFLNGELSGREFIAGDRISVADITGMIAIDFMKPAKIALPESLTHVGRWYGAMKARPSAAA
jgi:glutathione S-transferase